MTRIINSFVLLAATSVLGGCGALGGACSGVELSTEPSRFGRTSVLVRNTADEAKLVTIGIIRGDGAEGKTHTARVDSNDIYETVVSNMREGDSVEIKECR